MPRLLLLTLAVSACGYTPKGVADTRTGLVGVPVAEGALAGDWATIAQFQTVVTAGVLGDKPGGFRSHFLVHREWKSGAYADTWVRCLRDAAEVAGTRTLVPNGTYAKLEPLFSGSHADHAQGTFETDDVIELWGVHNLPEPATSPLPTQANYMMSPQSEQVFDDDDDGNPAITELSHGTVSGTMYVVERTVFTLAGTVLSDKRVQGIVTMKGNNSNRLGATSGWLLGESAAKVDPSRVAWFDSAKLAANATCADVAAAVSAGDVSITQPFQAPAP